MLLVPAAIVLALREWRRCEWELRGSWWGLLPTTLALATGIASRNLVLSWHGSPLAIDFLPRALPLYLYASGVILLFAGMRVWRQAWFPLALLLCAQPVPGSVVYLFDLPMQNLAAHAARSFASMIGFPPASPELLRLMFTPQFGMFIAPGCDGMRGAVVLGYAALIVGYLKRVPAWRWFFYVAGGVLLGHVFNLIRLCALVLYYRIAVGHSAMENAAAAADYVIGGVLFLSAVILFLSIVLRTDASEAGKSWSPADRTSSPYHLHTLDKKLMVFSVLALAVMIPGVHAIQGYRQSLAASVRSGTMKPQDLDNLLPKQIGNYVLVRAWQEGSSSVTLLESGAYKGPASDEITIGVWLPPSRHSVHYSWMTHGESPQLRANISYATLQRNMVSFDTGLYRDGVSDRLAGSVDCTPSRCQPPQEEGKEFSLVYSQTADYSTRGTRAVSMFFAIERPSNQVSNQFAYQELSAEAQSFLAGVSFTELSHRFQ